MILLLKGRNCLSLNHAANEIERMNECRADILSKPTAYLTLEEMFVSVFVSVIVWLLVVPKEPSYKMTGGKESGVMVTVACWARSV